MHMKQKASKRFATAALAAVLAFGLAPVSAFAADDDVIDTTRTDCKLTLIKYNDEDGALAGELDDSYKNQAERDKTIDDLVHSKNLKPMEGIEFTLVKAGTIGMNGVGTTPVGLEYTVDNELANFLGLGANPASQKELAEKLSGKTQEQLETFVGSVAGATKLLTNAEGKVEFTGLGVGLYLVVETGYPSTISKTAEPFFVSLPTADNVKDGSGNVTDTKWLYEVTAYPKNQDSSDNYIPEKDIIKDGNSSNASGYQIGDYITFSARTPVPSTIGRLQVFRLVDTLSEGLSWGNQSFKVYGIKAADGAREELVASTHYTFAQNSQVLTWEFLPVSLADSNGKAIYSGVEVEYQVRLNEKAKVEYPGNTNDLELQYSKTTGTTTGDLIKKRPTKLPSVRTHAIDILKYGDGNQNNKLANVTFKLTDNQDKELTVSETTADTPGSYYRDPTGTATLTTDADGKLYVSGLGTGTYYLTETATNNGYSLLEKPIEVTITSNEKDYQLDAQGTFVKVEADTRYFADPAGSVEFILPAEAVPGTSHVDFGTSTVYQRVGTAPEITQVTDMYKQPDYQATTSVGTMENGAVKLLVNNSKGFQLPSTGGAGTIAFFAIGGLMIAVAAVVLLATRRRKSDEPQA